LKKQLLKKSKLYIILDKDACRDVFKVAAKIRNSGLSVVQLRAKNMPNKDLLEISKKLKFAFRKNKIIFIINDHVDIAKLTGAHGAHLGQDDLPIEEARKILGKDKIIGISCHNLKQALDAQKKGADYIGVGPIFKTPIKPENRSIGLALLKDINKKIKIPIFAIGGINRNNLNKILSTGVSRVAICRDICMNKNAAFSIKEIKGILNDAN